MNERETRRREPEDTNSSDGAKKRKKRKLRPESLEERILLSGTWVDADTGDVIDGATGGNDVYFGSEGADLAEAGEGDDALFGGGGDDFIEGDAGNDTIDGGSGDDVVSGGEGDDVVSGGEGDDLIVGGAGNDTVSFENADGGVDVDLASESATGEGADQVIGFENVTGSSHDDTITGDGNDNILRGGSGADTIDGAGGDDTIEGGSGNDILSGGAGRDTVRGGAGDDVLLGGAGDDTLEGGEGHDTLDGGADDDTLVGGLGDDVLSGGAGIDTVDYSGAANGVNVNLETGAATGEGSDTIDGVENITGSSFDDTLTGDAGANTIDGGAGNNVITGGGGADDLRGGAGDDVFYADGDDTIDGGSGYDTVNFANADSGVTFDPTTTGIESVVGSSHDDVFTFTGASDGDSFVIDGAGGNNTIDLSNFDQSALSIDDANNTITVDLGSGESFTIEFTNINHVNVGGVDGPSVSASDVIGSENESVTIHTTGLSGSNSALSYSWTQVSGPSVELSGADTDSPSFEAPELSANATMRFQLEVSDGETTNTHLVTVGITAENDPIVLDVGPDQIVSEGDAVTLSSSTVDPEGKPVVTSWTQIDGPSVELSGGDTDSPSFTAPNLEEDTELTFQITASDGEHEVTETVTVIVEAANDAVLVTAMDDVTVDEGADVQLLASATDPDSENLSYSWTQTGGPSVALSGSGTSSPSFTAPDAVANTELTFEVSVTDGDTTSTDSVTVTVNATDDAPYFTSAPNLSVNENEVVQLGATAIDPDGGAVSYSWSQIGGPEVSLSGADSQTPSFTAPDAVVNTYVSFEVRATDGVNTTVERVDVLVNADNDAPVVDAGANVFIDEGGYVDLIASTSDPEGKALAHTWTQIGGPEVEILSAGSANAQFATPDVSEPTELTFQIEATDGNSTTIDTVTITVNPVESGAPGGDPGGGDPGGGDPGGGGPGGGEQPDGGGEGGGEGGGDPGPAPDPEPQPLIVNAPAIIEATEGEIATLSLDLIQSTGDVSYSWSQIAGTETITLDGADTANPSFTVPEHTDNEIYIFEATVEDETGVRTVQVNLQVNADNDGPTVDVDDSATQQTESTFTIGSTVSDPEGQNLSYQWVQVGGPEVNMFNDNSPSLRFSTSNLNEPSDLSFELQVSDGNNVSTDLVTITAQPGNSAPIVDAGNDLFVSEGDTVRLTSIASDVDQDDLSYAWVQTGGPEVTLDDPTAASPTFEAPNIQSDEPITFELTVSDGAESATDSVTVHIAAVNDPPTVNAGAFQTVNENDVVNLSASGTDPEGGHLTYSWTQVGGPSVDITNANSADASFTAPEDVTNTYLTFEVEATDGEHTVVDRVVVLVNADNDAPVLDAGGDFVAQEESIVQLSATAADPEGQPLTHTWTQTGGPPVELSDPNALNPTFEAPNVLDDTPITFQITTTDGEHTVVDTISVTIVGENDAPTPINATTTMTEDTTGPVIIAGADPDLGDTIEQFRIDALPGTGTLIANGQPVAAGDTFTAEQIAGGALTYEPPADWNGSTEIQFSAFDGQAWSDTGVQSIVVVGDADAPTVTTVNASGVEETPIPLEVGIELTDTDGSESITKLEVTGAPTGTVFTDGVNTVTAWNGTADITALNLNTLSMTPGANHDTDFTLTFNATSTEADSGDTAVGAATLDVHIDPVNDPPIPQNTTITVSEDTTATVNIKAIEVDTGDTPETYRIDSLPGNGALTLNGQAVEAGDEISANDVLAGKLTFEPDADWSGETSLTFSAFDGQVWSEGSGTFTIEVEGVADDAIVNVSDVFVTEDGTASIDISAAVTDTDGSETVDSIRIDGAPVGTVFTDGVNSAFVVGDSVDVTGWDLENLEITPTANYDQDFDLSVDVTTKEAGSGDTHTTSQSVTVHVNAVNDVPVVQAGSVSVNEDTTATINLEASDVDTGDTIETYRIELLPDNGTLLFNGESVAEGQVLDAAEVNAGALTFEPDLNWSGETSLRFSASDGQSWSQTQGDFTINIGAVADGAVLDVADASGLEDSVIDLDVSSALSDTDGSETLAITVAGMPEGASLSAGVDNGDGTWTLTPDQLDGLTVTPPSNFSGDFQLDVTATTTEADGHSTNVNASLTVSVEGVADAPILGASDVSGIEDSPIPLDINVSLSDTDGSETLNDLTIAGVPEGASFSAGVDNGDGTWTLSPNQLDGLTITPPSNYSGEFDLTVTASSAEADGHTIQTQQAFTVHVDGVADDLTLDVADASGFEDSAIDLDISSALSDTDGSETLAITIAGMPEGASLSAGVDNGDGTWTLTPDQLDGLSVTPPSNFSGDFQLDVTATTTEADGHSTNVNASLTVNVEGVADAPILGASDVSGIEDSPIPLDINVSLSDTDGSETLNDLTIAGLPEGATLSAGVDNGDGTWTLAPDQLDGLTITPPSNYSGEFDLTVTASSAEADGHTIQTQQAFTVHVDGVADDLTLDVADASGFEDSAIDLDISSALSDTDGSETLAITIAGMPEGATLSAGVDNGDGTWTLTQSDLDNLRLTPAADDAADFTLAVTATTTEADGDSTSVNASLNINIQGVADLPELDVASVTGQQDTSFALDIASALNDADGSETLSITISNVPNGAVFSTGVDNGDGSWTFTPRQLEGLNITPPPNFAGELDLTVTATAIEADGDMSIANASLTVTVTEDPKDLPEVSRESDWNESAWTDPDVLIGEGSDILGAISEPGGIDETLDRIDLQAHTLTELGFSDEDGADLGYEFIGEVPPLDLEGDPVDAVPPPSEPLYELVEARTSAHDDGRGAPAPNNAPTATADEPEPSDEPVVNAKGQSANMFVLLWSLVRSIGPRQRTDTNDD